MSASPGQVIAAVLLPPLGAYLAAGPGRDFAITCVLTALAVVPGMVFALYLVLRPAPALA
jgi:uncharacterized membrane protein YqaE (UPF0057 family)